MQDGSLELVRQIGEGGHSVVFLARRHGGHGFQRLVAVKVVRRDPDLPSVVNERFLHEARLLGMLRHRGIVTADNVVELSLGTAIVMEYVPGLDLSDVARLQSQRPGRVPLGWLAHVGLEVTNALQAAWSWPSPVTGAPLRVLHCDVKPSNVRITADGAVKLLDFGVSTSSIDDTASGPLMGTIAYAAPERSLDGQTLPAGDLFSLGLTLLAVARGRPMRGRPLRPEAFEEWVEHTIGSLSPEFAPMLGLLRDLTSVEPEVRPTHSEARERLFELFRSHASQPPSDVSEALIQMRGRERAEASESSTGGHRTYVPATTSTLPSAALESPSTEPDTLPEIPNLATRSASGMVTTAQLDTGLPEESLSAGAAEVLEHAPLLPGMGAPRQLGPAARGPAKEAPAIDETLVHELRSATLRPAQLGPPPVDETFIHGLDASPMPTGEASELDRLVSTWFTGAPPEGSISHGDATQLLPPVQLLGPLAAFGGWFPLDAAVSVLGDASMQSLLPGGVMDALQQMLSFGWLDPRRDGVVPALRVSRSREATASHAWARLAPDVRTTYQQAARAALTTPFSTHAALLDAAWGAGPGPSLAHDISADLLRVQSTTPRPRELCVAAALAGRTPFPLDPHRERLTAAAAQSGLSDPERRMLRGWAAHAQLVDPWGPVTELVRQLHALVRSATAGASPAACAWYAAMLTRAARLSGSRSTAQYALATGFNGLGEGEVSTATALLTLEQAELAVRDRRLSEVMGLCSRARAVAENSFADLISVRALCVEAHALQARGESGPAILRARRAVHLADGSGCARHFVEALTTRGIVSLLNNALDEAVAELTEASERAVDVGQRTWVLAWLGGAQLRRGLIPQARESLRRLDPQTDGLPPEVLAVVRAWDARLATLLHEPTKARQAMRSARAALEQGEDLVLPTVRAVVDEAGWLLSRTQVHRRSPPST